MGPGLQTILLALCSFAAAAIFVLVGPSAGSVPQPPPDPPPSAVPNFVSSPIRAKHEQFLRDVIEILLRDGVFFNEKSSEEDRPFRWRHPEDLSAELGPALKLGEEGSTHEELLAIIAHVIKYSPRSSHRYMLDKRVAGLDPYALAADWLISTVNGNGATYNLAPVFILMELEMAQRLSALFRWRSENSDGITTPGAGAANAMAVTLALQEKFPGLKEKGLYEPAFSGGGGNSTQKAAIFVSELASTSFEKAARYQGERGERIIVIKVFTDPKTGRMDLEDLRAKIGAAKSQGLVPFMVVGTAGTEDLGSVDDLEGIATICHEHALWLHVDAHKGGPLIFSPTLRSRLHGIQRANSVTFGSWMLATPYVTTMLLVQDHAAGAGTGTQKLQNAFGTHARYLYKSGADLYNGSYDNGDSTVQASRRMEVVKLWYSWRARGTEGLAGLVNTLCSNAALFAQEVTKRTGNFTGLGFRLVLQNTGLPGLPLVAFNYIPKRLAELHEESDEFVAEVTKVTQGLRTKLLQKNLMQISIGRSNLPSQPDFFVVSLANSVLQPSDFGYIMDLIEAMAESGDGTPLELPQPPPVVPAAVSGFNNGNSPLRSLHETLFQDTFKLFLEKGIFFSRKESPLDFMEPDDLRTRFDFETLENRAPATHAVILDDFEKALKYSPHRGHPYFFFQLLAGLDPYTLAADYVASALNTPMRSYEDSPVFTLMEQSLMAAFRKRIFGTTVGDGVVTDGGSMANQMAIALALRVKMKSHPDANAGKKFVGYMSQDAHYSTRKGFILQNLGSENLVEVESNERGQMRPEKLEAAIKRTLNQGNVPFFVCITTGTTVYGAIDPVAQIVDMCAKYELWCHVDGMVGGLLAMSDEHRHRLAGLERVDSLGTDLHKLMGSTLTIAVLVTRRVGILRETFAVEGKTEVDYLYNRTEWDRGSYHYQTDKRNNVFKFWLLWKAKGRLGFEGHLNLVMDNAAYLVEQLHRRREDGFLPVLPEYDLTNVCFYYVPRTLRKYDQNDNGNSNGTATQLQVPAQVGRIWRRCSQKTG